MKKKHIVTVCCCLALAAFAYLVATAPLPMPPAHFQGTYSHGTLSEQILFSIFESDGEFYYADQNQHKFILGTVEDLGDNRYSISCPNPDSAAWIPDQVVTHENDGENAFYAEIEGETLLFENISDTTTIIGPQDRYS